MGTDVALSRGTHHAGALPAWVYSVAPCLGSGPLAKAGSRAVAAALALGDSQRAWVLRSCAVVKVFEWCEEIFRHDEPPREAFAGRLGLLADWFERSCAIDGGPAVDQADVPLELRTGQHYGELFRRFDASSFWEEPARVLRERLERNGVRLGALAGSRVLDAGCGGGRYAVAWRALGARFVTAIDFSATGVQDGERRAVESGIENVRFVAGNVLDLPCRGDSFDVVFSNGVLHHTTDWRRGLRELVRVLRPGAFGWLYLIEEPGGLFWDAIEILRAVMRGAPPELARATLRLLGVPPNRVFYMLDHVLVPINLRLTAAEVEDALLEAGAARPRRLTRGCDYDRVEQIHRRVPFAAEKFGVGEHRYVFSR